jgi:hypothetical protein
MFALDLARTRYYPEYGIVAKSFEIARDDLKDMAGLKNAD